MNRTGVVTVGIDGSPGSALALEWAAAESVLRQAKLRVVHAWHTPYGATPLSLTAELYELLEGSANEVLDDACDASTAMVGGPVERILDDRPAVDALLHAAATSDLLVVGSRGRGGFVGMLLGSVSSVLSHHCSCPLVIVPTPDAPTD